MSRWSSWLHGSQRFLVNGTVLRCSRDSCTIVHRRNSLFSVWSKSGFSDVHLWLRLVIRLTSCHFVCQGNKRRQIHCQFFFFILFSTIINYDKASLNQCQMLSVGEHFCSSHCVDIHCLYTLSTWNACILSSLFFEYYKAKVSAIQGDVTEFAMFEK